MKYQQEYVVRIQKDYYSDSSKLLDKLKISLQKRGLRTENLKNRINFYRPSRISFHTGENKLEVSRTFRVGNIVVLKKSITDLKIKSQVSLFHLICIAIITGLAFALMAFFFFSQGNLLHSFFFGAIPMILILVFGYKNIHDSMQAIIEEGVKS